MFCPSCGIEVKQDQKFCAACGANLRQPTSESHASATKDTAPLESIYSENRNGGKSSTRFAEDPVALESIYSGFWRRTFALALDYFIIMLAYGLLVVVLRRSAASSVQMTAIAAYTILALVYYPAFESSKYQATLGKRALGIKVTDLEGNRIAFGRALGRYFGRFLSGLTLGVGYLMNLFTERRQTLHDKLAGTLVVNGDAEPEVIANAGPGKPLPTWVLVFGTIGFVFCNPMGIGILAAIAIPAYQDYVIRAQVVEGLSAASGYKIAVEQMLNDGTALNQITSASLPGSPFGTSKYVDKVDVFSGVVAIKYGASANTSLAGKTLVLTPGRNGLGNFVWACGLSSPQAGVTYAIDDFQQYTSVPNKYLPLACRNQ